MLAAKTPGPAIWRTRQHAVDTTSRVILGVEASPALFHQQTVAARKMMERVQRLGVQVESLAADKAYGSGEFLSWVSRRACNRTFRSSIASTKAMDASPGTVSLSADGECLLPPAR